jgi:amphi-Trp domain-containing protein
LETEVELMELKEKTTLSREEAAARLHAIADELASNNDVVIEREDLKFVAHVPDQVHLKVEFVASRCRSRSKRMCGVVLARAGAPSAVRRTRTRVAAADGDRVPSGSAPAATVSAPRLWPVMT